MATKSYQLELVVLFWAMCSVSGEPSCKDTSNHYEVSYTCSGFSSPEDFEDYVERPLFQLGLTFILKDSLLNSLPVGAFKGVNASLLELNNATLPPSSNWAALSELEHSLERITFSYDSTLPDTWNALQVFPKLKTLSLSKMSHVYLSRDFNNLPQSIRGISVLYSTIERIDEDWLSDLGNLEYLVIRDSHLKKFSRLMLPRPAPKLRSIDLKYVTLSYIRKDIQVDCISQGVAPDYASRLCEIRSSHARNTYPRLSSFTYIFNFKGFHFTMPYVKQTCCRLSRVTCIA